MGGGRLTENRTHKNLHRDGKVNKFRKEEGLTAVTGEATEERKGVDEIIIRGVK